MKLHRNHRGLVEYAREMKLAGVGEPGRRYYLKQKAALEGASHFELALARTMFVALPTIIGGMCLVRHYFDENHSNLANFVGKATIVSCVGAVTYNFVTAGLREYRDKSFAEEARLQLRNRGLKSN